MALQVNLYSGWPAHLLAEEYLIRFLFFRVSEIYLHHTSKMRTMMAILILVHSGMLTRKQAKTYRDFYDAARHNDSLPENETILIHLAAAMALGCYP